METADMRGCRGGSRNEGSRQICLCDQYLSGPIHRVWGFYSCQGFGVGVAHKGEAGLLLLPSLPYKVGVLGAGSPTSPGHRKCHKRRIIPVCLPVS